MSKSLLHNALIEVFKYGFLTGSQVDGTATTLSDWDIVVPKNKLDEFKSKIFCADSPIDKSIETCSYNGGVKIYCASIDNIINLIPVSEQEFISWYYTTLTMKNFWLKFNISTDKDVKHEIFETFNSNFLYIAKNMVIDDKKCLDIAEEARNITLNSAVNTLLNLLTEENSP